MPWVVRFPPYSRTSDAPGATELWLQVEWPEAGPSFPIFRAVASEADATRWPDRAEVVALILARHDDEATSWRRFVIEEVP